MVVRWDRALYGWVPSCYEWGEEFYDWFVSYGAVACYSDTKVFDLFVLVRDFEIAGTPTRAILIITLHVDDLLMAHSHVQLREQFMRDNPYKIKDGTWGRSPTSSARTFVRISPRVLSSSLSRRTSSLRPVVY